MYRVFIALSVVVALMVPTPGWAGGGLQVRVRLKARDSAVAAGALVGGVLVMSHARHGMRFETHAWPDRAFVVIDATPPEARVFLDGRPLGEARQLVARAFPVSPGRHTVEIVSPGFRSYRAQLFIDASFPTSVRVALEPE